MATMPALTGQATLLDFAKSIDPDGKVARVVELLNQTNEILTDMQWIEGNLPTGHRTTIRTGLPTPTWRKLYNGVQPTKSIRAQVDDACGLLEMRTEIDVDFAKLNGNSTAFRLSENIASIEGLNQGFSQALFYGDSSINPEQFTGLSPRYNNSTAGNGQNVIKMGGSANANCSIWLVGWGPDTCTGIFPKASQAGIEHTDLGEFDAFDSNNYRFRAYGDLWKWKCGISLRDWRYVVRGCNIDVNALVADTTGSTVKIIELMLKMLERIPALGMCRPVFYVNRTVREMLRIQAMNKSQAAIRLAEGADQFYVAAFGVPVRLCDRLLTTEANVS